MEKGFDLRIQELKIDLGTTINDANMPIYVIKMILNELLTEVSMLTNQAIETQQKIYDESIKKEQHTNTTKK